VSMQQNVTENSALPGQLCHKRGRTVLVMLKFGQ
jgi:hypothetical protein